MSERIESCKYQQLYYIGGVALIRRCYYKNEKLQIKNILTNEQ